MPPVSTRALILHAFPYSETSKILRLLTPGYGLRSVIAKGALRPKSRFGGVLEPFTEGEAEIQLREGRELLTLSEFSLVRSRQGIGRDLGAFAGASLLAELALRFATEEAFEELYRTVAGTLDALNEGASPAATTTALTGVWTLISLLGFQPELELCVRCGRPFPEQEASRFDVEAGGTVCRECRPSGRLLEAGVRMQVARMSAGLPPASDLVQPALHGALLQAFLAAHLGENRPLKALPLFLEQLR